MKRQPIQDIALIFDMDGVVVDSNPAHCEAWIEYNRRHGLETTDAMLQRMYGRRNDDIVIDFFGTDLSPEEIHEHGAAKERLYREMVTGKVDQMLTPGLREFLEEFRDVPKAVASNAETANVNFILDQAGLRTYFQVVVTGQDVARPKPHPDVYLRAAELLGVKPERCIIFEDSHSGVAAGVAAGMRVIGVCTTHDYLSSTSITVDNFIDGRLRPWLLQAQAA